MPKKNILRVALDNLKEALQSLSVKRAVEVKDKRSISRGKTLVKEIEKNYRDKDAAAALEISRQKYTSLKMQIKKGKVASSTLNDLLNETRGKLDEGTGRPRDLTGDYITSKPIRGKRKFKIDYVEMGDDFIKQKMPWAVNVKPGGFASKQSALNWYGGVTGGKEYFKIVKGKRGRYFIYDTRTASERSRKGSVSGSTRAEKIIERSKLR